MRASVRLARETLRVMLEDREYTNLRTFATDAEIATEMNKGTYRDDSAEKRVVFERMARMETDQATVIFSLKPKMGVNDLKSILEKFEETAHLILVVSIMTPFASKFVAALDREIEIFEIGRDANPDLRFPVTRHYLVPPHRKMRQAEIDALLARHPTYKIKDFPKIGTNDPVARHFNFREGDVIEIMRRSYYGLVVPEYRVAIQGRHFFTKQTSSKKAT